MSEGKTWPVGDGGASFLDASALIVAAHELKSPLALIRQLSLELEQASSKEIRPQLVEQIRLSAERALRLTNDLTKSARAQAQLFEQEPISPQRIIGDVARELHPLYAAHQRMLVTETKRGVPLVSANYDLLRRILCNFADNALRYGDDRGRVTLYNKQQKQTQLVRFGVRDYGPLVPQTAWHKLEHVFSSTPYVSSSRPESSGLGLTICRQFAEAMGATIGLVQHRDGMSFYVDVPMSKQLSLL